MARQVGATARFSDKVAVVTGGANGIGRATALRLAADGAKVAVLDNEDEPLQAVANTIATEIGGSVLALHVDLTEQAAVIHAFETVGGELGEVDILVNNVGQTARALSSEFWESEPETWDFVLDVSLKTTLMCSRQVVPGMRARAAGKIVNTASDAALIGDAGIADYSAAKGGVISFTRSLARELAAFKVNVNAVCPGPTKTRGPMSVPGVLERAVAQIPMGEMCEPEDIANAIAFLASNEARFVTGQILAVNGGRVFHEEEHEMTTPAENKEIVTRSFAATLPTLRIDVLKELYAPEVIDHSPLLGRSAYDLDVLQQTAAAFLAGFPDFAIELDHVMADGDKVSYFETVSGTHTGDFLGLAPTGKTMEAHASHIVRIADGRIVEHWAVRDYRGLTEFLPGPPPD